MKTECTHSIGSFRFTVTGKCTKGYAIEIEYTLPWEEKVIVNGTLIFRDGDWRLTAATFEDAHDEAVWRQFMNDLLPIRNDSYIKAIAYYVVNRQPDIFEAIDNLKKAI